MNALVKIRRNAATLVHKFSVAAMKHVSQKQLEGEGVFLAYTVRSLFSSLTEVKAGTEAKAMGDRCLQRAVCSVFLDQADRGISSVDVPLPQMTRACVKVMKNRKQHCKQGCAENKPVRQRRKRCTEHRRHAIPMAGAC